MGWWWWWVVVIGVVWVGGGGWGGGGGGGARASNLWLSQLQASSSAEMLAMQPNTQVRGHVAARAAQQRAQHRGAPRRQGLGTARAAGRHSQVAGEHPATLLCRRHRPLQVVSPLRPPPLPAAALQGAWQRRLACIRPFWMTRRVSGLALSMLSMLPLSSLARRRETGKASAAADGRQRARHAPGRRHLCSSAAARRRRAVDTGAGAGDDDGSPTAAGRALRS